MIPVRHPLNLIEKYPECGISLETAQETYSNGDFEVWEVNARNVMQEMAGVISAQKAYALPDAIGIAYTPYNRHQTGDWRGYEGGTDPMSLLLAGGNQFAVSAHSEEYPYGFRGPLTGSYTDGKRVYEFSLIVTYGVHHKYFIDTSYGATEYRHRPKDSNPFIDCGYGGPCIFSASKCP